MLTFTYIVPIATVIPGVYIESIMSSFVDKEPYSNVGKATIYVLIAIFLVSIIFILLKARKSYLSNIQIIAIMIIEYFILHILGFYIYWGIALDFRSDGQLIFAAVSSFPYSSFGFVILGFLVDSIKKKLPKVT